MTEDFDCAQSQPLKPSFHASLMEKGPIIEPGPLAPPITVKQAGEPTITQAELLAWRAYMRANPPLPEKKQIHHSKPWQEPEEWMRRDGSEQ